MRKVARKKKKPSRSRRKHECKDKRGRKSQRCMTRVRREERIGGARNSWPRNRTKGGGRFPIGAHATSKSGPLSPLGLFLSLMSKLASAGGGRVDFPRCLHPFDSLAFAPFACLCQSCGRDRLGNGRAEWAPCSCGDLSGCVYRSSFESKAEKAGRIEASAASPSGNEAGRMREWGVVAAGDGRLRLRRWSSPEPKLK